MYVSYAKFYLNFMKTIGIEIDNDRAIFFIIEKNGNEKTNITNDFKHLKLNDERDNNEVRNFQSLIFTHFDNINPNRIAILTRQTKGKFASSAISFKIEALIKCYNKVNVEFVSPQAINSFYKTNVLDIEILHNYQEKAAKLSNLLL